MEISERDIKRLADRLLRETVESGVYRDNDGEEEWHTWREAPLLGMLREAAHPGMGAGGGGGARTAGSPAAISVEAVSLFMDIEREALDAMWADEELRARARQWNSLVLEDRVRIWVELWRTRPAQRLELHRRLARWVTQVEALLDPAKVISLRGAPCPVCSQTWAMVAEDGTGELVRQPALLVAVGTTQVVACCRVCGERWQGPTINDLADALKPDVFASDAGNV
ncbi:hypothetical protein BJH93_04075 [Kocuria polaris]|nr:hypothetical protein [Kocuria polaris]